MQNTFNLQSKSDKFIKLEEELISSLIEQPIIIVLRPRNKDLEEINAKNNLFLVLTLLYSYGIKHVEVSWLKDSRWLLLMKFFQKEFPKIKFGAASITTYKGLNSLSEAGLNYATSPTLSKSLQNKARGKNIILIPGVFSPTEIQKSKRFGCKIIKIFPATKLGLSYINQIYSPLGGLPFLIAAGGLNVKDINLWLKAGYNTITLGRKIIKSGTIDSHLLSWLKKRNL